MLTPWELYKEITNIPEYLFLIPSTINGVTVWFSESYQYILLTEPEFFGTDFPLIIVLWREVFHLVAVMVALAVIFQLGEKFFKTQRSIRIMIALLGSSILVQELIIHPVFYDQTFTKGALDLVVWLSPVLYTYYIWKKSLSR